MSLLAKGLSLGAMMALVIGGAGASLPELVILKRLFKMPLLIAFLLVIFSMAVVTGAGFQSALLIADKVQILPNTKEMDRVFYFIMDARRIQCLAERVLELGLEAVRRFVWPNQFAQPAPGHLCGDHKFSGFVCVFKSNRPFVIHSIFLCFFSSLSHSGR